MKTTKLLCAAATVAFKLFEEKTRDDPYICIVGRISGKLFDIFSSNTVPGGSGWDISKSKEKVLNQSSVSHGRDRPRSLPAFSAG